MVVFWGVQKTVEWTPCLKDPLPNIPVGELRAGIEVAPHGAAEEGHVLGDGPGEAPQPRELNPAYILMEKKQAILLYKL